MSVRLNERSKGKYDAYIKAKDMIEYTLEVISNERTFPRDKISLLMEEDRCSLPEQVEGKAAEILLLVIEANELRGQETLRRSRLRQAKASCRALLTLLEVCIKPYHIKMRRVEYWTGLIVEVIDGLDDEIAKDYPDPLLR